MKHWQIEFWVNENDVCFVEKDLLKKMRKKEGFILSSLEDKMDQYTNTDIINVQKLDHLEKVKSEESMWELKFSLHKNEIRFLGCLVFENNSHTFYALCAFKKKDQKITNDYRFVARNRIKEFINISKQNELQKIL